MAPILLLAASLPEPVSRRRLNFSAQTTSFLFSAPVGLVPHLGRMKVAGSSLAAAT